MNVNTIEESALFLRFELLQREGEDVEPEPCPGPGNEPDVTVEIMMRQARCRSVR